MSPPAERRGPVLAVDLDGTLLRGDLLAEGLVRLVLPRAWRIVGAVGALARGGRAGLKSWVGNAVELNGLGLPWNSEAVAFCASWAERGGQVVLATAADAQAARRVTSHFPFISRVIGSEGGRNLKGAAKAAGLVEAFGVEGFDYVGDSSADVPVWRAAKNAWLVGTERERTAFGRELDKPLQTIAGSGGTGAGWWRALRPHQWLKNLLVFFPLIAAHRWTDATCWGQTGLVFFGLCALASAAYLINDLADLDADREHPRKRGRPFASGAWPISSGVAAAACLVVVGLGFASLAGWAALLATGGYFLLSLLYSLVFKTMPILDAVFLSGLYTYRMILGGVAAGVMISPWLLAFSTTFFLGLAFLKRFVELTHLPDGVEALLLRRGYGKSDLGFVLTVGVASGFLSVVVLALYLDSSASRALYAAPEWLWLIALILLFWILRVWFLAGRKAMHDDPVWFAARDGVTLVLGILCVFVVAAAKPI